MAQQVWDLEEVEGDEVDSGEVCQELKNQLYWTYLHIFE